MRSVAYQEFSPAPALASVVQSYWRFWSRAPLSHPVLNRVLPDGCIDIVLSRDRSPVISGAMTQPRLRWYGGSVDLLGVRFWPGGAWRMFPQEMDELTDLLVAPERHWKLEWEWIIDPPGVAARIARLERVLLRRLKDARAEGLAAVAAGLIRQTNGATPVAALEEKLGVSSRQIERRFRAETGLSPKTLCRITRFLHALKLLRRAPQLPGADLAGLAGYFDQPHLLREFQTLAGLTPRAWLAERQGVAFAEDNLPPL